MRTCIYWVQVVAEVIARTQLTRAATVAVVAMPKVKLQLVLVRVTQSLLVKLVAVFRR
jgi:uncharacterized membrane protein